MVHRLPSVATCLKSADCRRRLPIRSRRRRKAADQPPCSQWPVSQEGPAQASDWDGRFFEKGRQPVELTTAASGARRARSLGGENAERLPLLGSCWSPLPPSATGAAVPLARPAARASYPSGGRVPTCPRERAYGRRSRIHVDGRVV